MVTWKRKRLAEVCTLQRGFDLPTKDRKRGTNPLVSSSGIADFIDQSKVRGPGVVTGRSGSIGNVFFVENDFWPLNTALYVKDFVGNDERFVFFLLQSLDLARFASGTGVPTLNRNHVRDEIVCVPDSIEEQRRIVAVLDEAFAAIATATANTEKNLANAQELLSAEARAIFAVGGDDWVKATLGSVCEMYQPQTIGKKDMVPDGPYPVFGANGPIGRYDRYNHEEPQLLVTCRGATCGSVNMSDPFSWITGNAMVVRPKDSSLRLGLLRSIFEQFVDFSKVITGAAQPQITRQSFAPVAISFPPKLADQIVLEQRLDAIAEAVRELTGSYEQKLEALAALKQSLLHRAFTGELTATMPETIAA
jgi:type I restriction enzyme S subunit